MARHTTLCLIAFFAFITIVFCEYKYDCRRLDDCKNGGTCSLGVCTCTSPYDGYNCGYDNTTSCDPDPLTCTNGATCYTINGSNVCACPYGFYGTNCQNESVSIQCEGQRATFSLAFPTEFLGTLTLYKDGATSSPECDFNESTETVDNNPGMKIYTLEVDLTDDDSGAPACNLTNIYKTIDSQTQAVRYTGVVIVSYMSSIVTSLDEIYNLTCSHDQSDIELSNDISGVSVVNDNLTKIGFNKTYSPVLLTVLDKNDDVLTSDASLSVGDLFKLQVYLTEDTVYSSVRFERCVANNTKTGSDEKTFTVFDKGCPTRLGKRLTSGQINAAYMVGNNPMPGKKLPIEAFKFVDSGSIGILCTAKICKSNDTSCSVPPDCEAVINQADTPTNGTRRRKKRAADDVVTNEDSETTVSTVINIRGPNEQVTTADENTGAEPTVELCLAKPEITATVTVLGAVVLILLLACFILLCRLVTRQGKTSHIEHVPHHTSDRFHIPRAHVNESFKEI